MYSKEEIEAEGLHDFRIFLCHVWHYLGHARPTPVQLDIAYQLQHGPKRYIICAFRGVGKSWLTVAFVAWLLFLNPQLKILWVSANETLAKDNLKFLRQIIEGMPLLQHLKPKMNARDNAQAFDVGPATDSKDPSVKCAGITGQITGNRADVVVSDDIEVPKNSITVLLRQRIGELVKEFDAVLKPNGRVLYLGTPQNEDSLYPKLIDRGYTMEIWTSEIPEKPQNYLGRLSTFIQKRIAAGWLPKTPIEPTRFPTADLDERRASYGGAGYALQYLLDTAPSDADRNPLKTKDLMILDVDDLMAYVKLVWSSETTIQDLHSGGLHTDCYVRPAWKSEEMTPFQGTVCMIDPSGKGKDETAYAIVRYCNGLLYLVDCDGFTDGFGEATLRSIAAAMLRHRVNYWSAEENYGGGMFAKLLTPVIAQVAEEMLLAKELETKKLAAFDEEFDAWSSTNKENRIIDTLGPLLKQHRLVVDRRVIQKDTMLQGDKQQYSLIYQLTRIQRMKGCLPNEDRVEAVSMAVSYWTHRMAKNMKHVVEDHKTKELDKMLKGWKAGIIQTGKRGRAPSPHVYAGRR